MKPFGFRKTFRFNKMQGRIRELRNDEDVGDCIRLCKTIHSFKSIEQDIEKIPPLHPPMPEKGTRFNELPMMEATCHELFNLAEKRHWVLSVIKKETLRGQQNLREIKRRLRRNTCLPVVHPA